MREIPLELFEHIILLTDDANIIKNFRNYFTDFSYNNVMSIYFKNKTFESNLKDIVKTYDIERLEYNFKKNNLIMLKDELINYIILYSYPELNKDELIEMLLWAINKDFILSKFTIVYLLSKKKYLINYIDIISIFNLYFHNYFKNTINIQISLSIIYTDFVYFKWLLDNIQISEYTINLINSLLYELMESHPLNYIRFKNILINYVSI